LGEIGQLEKVAEPKGGSNWFGSAARLIQGNFSDAATPL